MGSFLVNGTKPKTSGTYGHEAYRDKSLACDDGSRGFPAYEAPAGFDTRLAAFKTTHGCSKGNPIACSETQNPFPPPLPQKKNERTNHTACSYLVGNPKPMASNKPKQRDASKIPLHSATRLVAGGVAGQRAVEVGHLDAFGRRGQSNSARLGRLFLASITWPDVQKGSHEGPRFPLQDPLRRILFFFGGQVLVISI